MDKISNYDLVCEQWREQFLTWDHEAMCRNLGLPGCYADRLEISYFKRPFRIDRQTGQITNLREPERKVSFGTVMALYHLLFYAKENPKNSGEWVPFRKVRGAAPFDPAFQRTVLQPFAERFAGKADQLKKIGLELGFHPLAYGDVSFYVEAFPCVAMQYIFWDGDEEFPPQCNILFDANITDFTHEETVVLLAQEGAELFLEGSGGEQGFL